MSDLKITGLTADTTPTTDDLVVTVNDPAGTPTNKKVAVGDLITASTLPAGSVVQVVTANFSASATGTTTIPLDNTAPQNTEGDEYMTLAITPKSATNNLVIDIVGYYSNSAITNPIQALFQDGAANSLAASAMRQPSANVPVTIITRHIAVAGGTSATTFKVRAGPTTGDGGTLTFNGTSATRNLGTVTKSSITIWEVKV